MPVLMHQVCGHDRQPCGLRPGCGSAPQARLTCHLPWAGWAPWLSHRLLLCLAMARSHRRFIFKLRRIPANSSFRRFSIKSESLHSMSTSLHPSPSLMLTGFGLQLLGASEKRQHYQYANSLAAATGRTTSLPNRSVSGCFPFLWGNLSGS